jgi:hypothetical protein
MFDAEKCRRTKAQECGRFAAAAIGVFRELGIDNDTILKEPGFRDRAKTKEVGKDGRPVMSHVRYVTSGLSLPMTDERTAVRRKRDRLRPKSLKRRD